MWLGKVQVSCWTGKIKHARLKVNGARKTLESGTTWVNAVENIGGGHIEVSVHCTWEFLELIIRMSLFLDTGP